MDAQRHRVDGVRTYEWTWWTHRRSKRVFSLSRFDPSRVDRKDRGLHGPCSIEWERDARPGHGPRCHVTPGGEREGASPPPPRVRSSQPRHNQGSLGLEGREEKDPLRSHLVSVPIRMGFEPDHVRVRTRSTCPISPHRNRDRMGWEPKHCSSIRRREADPPNRSGCEAPRRTTRCAVPDSRG